ncbi:adenylosuccinate lyase [Bordetella sp. 15P40C-2]|uniref:adenylosuccinate lyase n=1 Tax=Bordetella sp. 15P40C-2 TaxID=2572246 RepID=UPI00132090F5|nr:adenylosuccinate lyase [Bordetella sp. 15P40C-2]MVW72731.1 adenylosuccinate lyase [Bordetella sp. 15P40C-2]
MATYVIDSALFRDQFGTEPMRAIFSDEATVQRWLDVEAALARVQGNMGVIPAAAAEEIQRKCKVENLDLAQLKAEMDRTAHPIVPLLRAMKKVCSGEAGEYIHWGATTQDIMDTGTILQVRDGLDQIETAYRELYDNVCTLARKYRDQVMVGRSHGQHALPITFGFKAAGWAEELRRNFTRLRQMRERVLVGQFSGAVGTLAALGNDGIEVQNRLFDELGLACPNITWHTSRDNIAELISVLAIACGTAGKIAHEIFSLQKTETAELEEPFMPGKVGSSTMPHKRNPPVCEGVIAVNRLVRATVPLAIEGIVADHERDKVVLQAEREYIGRIFNMVHVALKKMAFVTAGLSVRVENMEKNLYIQKGLLMSEAVMMAMSDRFGRQEAHEVIYQICMDVFEKGGSLKEALMQNDTVSANLTEAEIDRMLEPYAYTGQAGVFVDRVLAVPLAG